MITSDRARLVCSSCGQAAYGTSDKVPKPFRANSYLKTIGAGRVVHDLVGARFQSPGFPRKIHSNEGPKGSVDRSAHSCYRGLSFLGFSPDTPVRLGVDACEIHALTARQKLYDTHLSTAICCSDRDQSGKTFRIDGSCVSRLFRQADGLATKRLCSAQSKTFDAHASQSFLSHIECMGGVSCGQSYHLFA